jgi:hypothetical protein
MKAQREISIWKWQAIALVSIVFFLFCCALAFQNGQRYAAVLFLPWVLLSLVALMAYGPINVSEEMICMRLPFGKVGIAISEIEQIESGSSHLVLIGKSKRLVVPALGYWSRKGKAEALAIISAAAQAKSIQCKWSFLADFKYTKNAKA